MKTIDGAFEELALRMPERPALVHGEDSVNYGELLRRVNGVVRGLRITSPDTPVGVILERGLDLITAILSILKAGAAYVPLDPVWPEERVRQLREDARLATVITSLSAMEALNLPPGAPARVSQTFRPRLHHLHLGLDGPPERRDGGAP